MKKYFSFFKIRFKAGLQYRTAAIAGIITQFFWGFMYLMMYKAFYASDPSSIPMPFDQLSSYIWLQQGLMALLFIWFWEGDIFSSIENGNIAYELCRPVSLYNMWFARILSTRLSRTVLRMIPLFSIALILPKPYNLALPSDTFKFLLFLISLSLGVSVLILLSIIIYSSAFYTISSFGTRIFVAVFVDFMAGGIIPLPFFPERIRIIAEMLPFSSITNVPLRIYIGHINGAEIIYHIGIQIFWLFLLAFISRRLLDKATRRVVVQGG
jgi:ABC-2 type transport system permease protein